MNKDLLIADDECWQNLANAIILNAADRYRKLNRKLQKKGYLEDINAAEFKEIENFFLSEWFMMLTSISGPDLLARLQAETHSHKDSERKTL